LFKLYPMPEGTDDTNISRKLCPRAKQSAQSHRVRKYQLKNRDPAFWATMRVIGFIGAIGVGAFLGWTFILDTPENDVRKKLAASDEIQFELAVPVQPTGTPVANLSAFVRVGWPAPDFTLVSLRGENHTLKEHAGEPVILNFWTTWCPPCLEEMPALQRVYENYQEEGLIILAIDLIEIDYPEQVEPYVKELGLTFPILLDVRSEVSEDRYHILGLPTSVFVDRQGTVREIYVGALPLDKLENQVQSIMEENQ
jgi:thiol-disulfide isomerase/thioredoxin